MVVEAKIEGSCVVSNGSKRGECVWPDIGSESSGVSPIQGMFKIIMAEIPANH